MLEPVIRLDARGRSVEFSLRLDPQQYSDAVILEHFRRGFCYESDLAWVMFRVLRDGDNAVDVGAHIGFFTLLMSRLVGQYGHVAAVEPGSNNLPMLRQHLESNRVSNVTIYQQPLWSKPQPVTFWLNSDNAGGNALFDPANWWSNDKSRANPQPIAMQSDTLDRVAGGKTIRLIKIDTEGAEQHILAGAAETLERDHPYVLVELNPHGMLQAGYTAETMRAYMDQFGYSLFFLHADDRIPSLIPEGTKIIYNDEVTIINALFSTVADVARAWPEATG